MNRPPIFLSEQLTNIQFRFNLNVLQKIPFNFFSWFPNQILFKIVGSSIINFHFVVLKFHSANLPNLLIIPNIQFFLWQGPQYFICKFLNPHLTTADPQQRSEAHSLYPANLKSQLLNFGYVLELPPNWNFTHYFCCSPKVIVHW